MSYLTRLALTRDGQRVAKSDRRALHSAIAWAANAEEGRVLWCLASPQVVIIQSPHGVNPSRLLGVATISGEQPRTQTWAESQPVTVSGVLCATRAKRNYDPDGKRRGQRVPVDHPDTWLRRRLDGAATLDAIEVEALPKIVFRKGPHLVTLSQVGFYSTGHVTDPEAFDSILAAGVGSGKAYGLGLLLAKGRAA